MRISDWSSDVCSSDLADLAGLDDAVDLAAAGVAVEIDAAAVPVAVEVSALHRPACEIRIEQADATAAGAAHARIDEAIGPGRPQHRAEALALGVVVGRQHASLGAVTPAQVVQKRTEERRDGEE